MKKLMILLAGGMFGVFLFWLLCGIFVIQPIEAIPNGVTIIYWRSELKIPFIASVDGMLDDSGVGVSILGRALMLATVAKPLMEHEIVRFGYSETLYLWSTGGKKYSR